ncbi:hypothetical protein V8E54_003688 [Elaphomyces granulatus]
MDQSGGAGASASNPPPERTSIARHTIGTCLLLVVVVLWTASNFLASTIFADNTYSKPFFVTYVNTSVFMLSLIPMLARRLYRLWRTGRLRQVTSLRALMRDLDSHRSREDNLPNAEIMEDDEAIGSDFSRQQLLYSRSTTVEKPQKLGLTSTAKLSFQFCMLWFIANYFASACLQYTTVGSTTILVSTSGIWTLILGVAIGVEKFSPRKSLGVIASLVGIILISRVDTSADDRGFPGNGGSSFPHKTPTEIALGDAMAAFSAMLYGIYTIVMKKQVGDESRVNMQLFFGLVGLFNALFLWPGFIIFHVTGVELFALPNSNRPWTIILVNSVISLVGDICWAYAMLLTTPLVVTVGLSLSIPLSLVGQIILQAHYASVIYWVGAAIVFLSFMVVNYESKEPDNRGLISNAAEQSRSDEATPSRDYRTEN